MSDKLLTLTLLLLLPFGLNAETGDSYECTVGDLVRRVEIMYETGMTLPCEVHYFKDTESPGESQVLWRAMNEAGYCEAKVAGFIEKLRASGWTCTGGSDTHDGGDEDHDAADADEDESEDVDDTDALEPAGEDDPERSL